MLGKINVQVQFYSDISLCRLIYLLCLLSFDDILILNVHFNMTFVWDRSFKAISNLTVFLTMLKQTFFSEIGRHVLTPPKLFKFSCDICLCLRK